MNNKFLWLLFMITYFTPPLSCSNQQPAQIQTAASPGDSLNLIIGITVKEESHVESIRAQLMSVNGITVMTFCTNMDAFIVRFADGTYSSSNEAFTACEKKLANDYKIFRKTGTTKELLNQCTHSSHDDPANIKELSR
jgi:hypothetical protein